MNLSNDYQVMIRGLECIQVENNVKLCLTLLRNTFTVKSCVHCWIVKAHCVPVYSYCQEFYQDEWTIIQWEIIIILEGFGQKGFVERHHNLCQVLFTFLNDYTLYMMKSYTGHFLAKDLLLIGYC